jgi:hypothetical protein
MTEPMPHPSAVAASAGARSDCQPSYSLNREKIRRILRSIQRMFERGLAHDVFEQFGRNRPPAPARFCEFGHTVFSGNNLCSYGHHAA